MTLALTNVQLYSGSSAPATPQPTLTYGTISAALNSATPPTIAIPADSTALVQNATTVYLLIQYQAN